MKNTNEKTQFSRLSPAGSFASASRLPALTALMLCGQSYGVNDTGLGMKAGTAQVSPDGRWRSRPTSVISGQIEQRERRTITIGANGFGSGYRAEAI